MVHSLFKVEPVATVYSGMAEVSERLPRVTMIKSSILLWMHQAGRIEPSDNSNNRNHLQMKTARNVERQTRKNRQIYGEFP
jgi:hypothetical protein